MSDAAQLLGEYKTIFKNANLPYSREILKFLLQEFNDIEAQMRRKNIPKQLKRFKEDYDHDEFVAILKKVHDDMKQRRVKKIKSRNLQINTQKVQLIHELLSHVQMHTNTILRSPSSSVNYLNVENIKNAKKILQLEAQKAIQNSEHLGIVVGRRIDDSDAQKAPIVSGH